MRIAADGIAKQEGISLNQFVALAVEEKIVRLEFLDSAPPDSVKADLQAED